MLARMSGGNANTIMKAVTSMYQANNGMRWIAIPGARVLSMATISSTLAVIAAISANVTPSSQKSAPRPGLNSAPVNGTYMNQPPVGTVSNTKLEYSSNPPNT